MSACQVHAYHWPKPLRTVVHHIQPLAMGGADVLANRVAVCDTGHYNVHRCLDDLLSPSRITRTLAPLRAVIRGTRKERALAKQGYDAWVTAGKPGKPVFELHFGQEAS